MELTDLQQLCQADGYARLRLGLGLYGWQSAVLNAMSERGARVAVRTCNESGKTATLVTSLILWHMESFLGSLTVTTSGSYRQVKDQLYPHLQAWGGRLGEGWEFGDGWGRFKPTGSRLVSFSTDNPGKAEGWHEPPRMPGEIAGRTNPLRGLVSDDEWLAMAGVAQKTSLMLVMDEAKTPPQALHDAFERCHATRWINLSSPGGSSGPFYDCFHKHAERWTTFQVRAQDCPHLWDDPLKRAEIECQIRTLRPELVQSMVYGEFMPTGSGQVFDMEAVDACMGGSARAVGAGQYQRGALDSSAGGDEQVLACCDGNRAWFEWCGFEKDDEKLVAVVGTHLRRCGLEPSACWSDDGGSGMILNNEFDRYFAGKHKDRPDENDGRAWIRRFNFNGQPRDAKLYLNVRAEAYFHLADLIRLGKVVLPDDEKLREELAFIRYDVDSTPIQLVGKKKFPRSPNRADALVMLFWEMDFEALTAAPVDRSDLTSPTRRRRQLEECAAGQWDA